jgi:serine/threonine protein kinase
VQSSPSLTGSIRGEAAATADLSGRCVGNSYVLVCPVGHGATGTVWRGIDRATGEYVAVKLLHEGLLKQPKLVIRFVQERTILMMMRHENIVGVRDLFSVGGSLALVMDYVSGGSLRGHLQSLGTLAPADAAELLAQVAAALAQAHELGVVHRDVKPDNILLQENEGRLDVRLTDFGIARVLDTAGLTTPQAIVGTPHYMAPEAISGEAVIASDIYAVGVVLFELITGHPPYAGEPLAVLRRHLDEEPQHPAGMPHEVRSLIEWCMAKNPDDRPNAAELGDALCRLAKETADLPALVPDGEATEVIGRSATSLVAVPHPSVKRKPSRRRPRNGPRSWVWRRPWLMVTLASATVVLSGLGGYNAWHLIEDGDKPASAAPPPQFIGGGPASAGAASGAPGARPTALPSGPAAGLPGLPGALPSGAAGGGLVAPAGAASQARKGAKAGATAGPVGGDTEVTFGPWRCGDEYTWDLGHPVLARPCHSLGPTVRVLGQMEAFPGIQADVSLTVRDASSDQVVAGPFVCKELMFTDFALKHNCGPVDMDVPHGGRYVVAESWDYTQRPLIPGGVARGPAFDW